MNDTMCFLAENTDKKQKPVARGDKTLYITNVCIALTAPYHMLDCLDIVCIYYHSLDNDTKKVVLYHKKLWGEQDVGVNGDNNLTITLTHISAWVQN